MAATDLKLTIGTIKSGRCILCLGPEVFNQYGEGKLEERLARYLDVENAPQIKVYEDGLFFFRPRQARTVAEIKMEQFFKETDFSAAEALLEKIARIPFHFIIISTPDNLLLQTFKRLQFNVSSGYYWKNHPPEREVKVPTRQQPLVYNMLGSIEHPESLVLTHDDLYGYMESIFGKVSMPRNLKYHITNNAKQLLFLGIPFDRWYMQMILRSWISKRTQL